MTVLNDSSLRCGVQNAQSQPCAFKALWFSDLPFILPTNSQSEMLETVMKPAYMTYGWVKRRFLDLVQPKRHLTISLHLYLQHLQFDFLGSCFRSRVIPFSLNKANLNSQSKIATHTSLSPASLGSLPSEIRLQIFKYLIEEDIVKVVGYSNGHEDVFTFKEKGYCPLPVMLTCRQFHAEMHEVYFDAISVDVKAVFTTAFDGDMSAFASEYFRRNVRDARISDPDTYRRQKMSEAFPLACIELANKGAASVRKGAYYFC